MEYWKNLSMENIVGETWKSVIEFEEIYEVSNLGRVKRISETLKIRNSIRYKDHDKKGSQKMLRQRMRPDGYLCVGLCRGKSQRPYYVHRLVAFSFVDAVKGKPHVNHKDSNRQNNIALNLEWCTIAENQKHASINKRFATGEDHHNSALTNEQAAWIRNNYRLGNGKIMAKQFNVDQKSILNIVKGKTYRQLL